MSFNEDVNDLNMIELAKNALRKKEYQDNPLRDILEVMVDMAEKYMAPKPKPRMTWEKVWEKLDDIFRCDK